MLILYLSFTIHPYHNHYQSFCNFAICCYVILSVLSVRSGLSSLQTLANQSQLSSFFTNFSSRWPFYQCCSLFISSFVILLHFISNQIKFLNKVVSAAINQIHFASNYYPNLISLTSFDLTEDPQLLHQSLIPATTKLCLMKSSVHARCRAIRCIGPGLCSLMTPSLYMNKKAQSEYVRQNKEVKSDLYSKR